MVWLGAATPSEAWIGRQRMTEDEDEQFSERAGIMQYDAGLPRAKAEQLAREDLARIKLRQEKEREHQ